MDVNDLNGEKAKIKLLGEEVEVEKNALVGQTIKAMLKERGIDSFTVVVNGVEVDSTEDLPEKFEDNVIEVQKYVKAGN